MRSQWRWVAGVVALMLSACAEGPTGMAREARVVMSFLTPATVRTVVVEVSGPGLSPAVVLNIPVAADSTARDTLTLTAGAGRRFVVTALDSAGVTTHRADTTITLQAGVNAPLAMRLEPLPSTLGITVTFGGAALTVADTTTRQLALGDTVRILASATRPDGSAVPADSIRWGTTNPALVSLSGGLVRVILLGESFVTASYRGATARVRIVGASGTVGVTFRNANAGLVAGEPDSIRVVGAGSALVEEFDYNVTIPFDYASAPLENGVAYRVRITGRAGVGPLDGSNYQNSMPDGAFNFCGFFENLDTCQAPGDGFGAAAWDAVTGRRPSPDVYTTAHTYDYYIIGRGVPLVWTFRDNPYSDNSGNLRIALFRLGSVVP